jgi:hypothetical protein
VTVKSRLSSLGRAFAPERLDKFVLAHDLARAQQKERKERALLWRSRRQIDSICFDL